MGPQFSEIQILHGFCRHLFLQHFAVRPASTSASAASRAKKRRSVWRSASRDSPHGTSPFPSQGRPMTGSTDMFARGHNGRAMLPRDSDDEEEMVRRAIRLSIGEEDAGTRETGARTS